jgi:hypothetical protein
MLRRSLVAVAAVLIASVWLRAEEWGHLTLRLVYDGPPPKLAPLLVAGAAAPGCGAGPFLDESLVVDPKDHGLANVFVYLVAPPGTKLPTHPDSEKSAQDEVAMANQKCHFEPHAVVLRTSQTFVGVNADPVGHNMKADPFQNTGFNLIIPAGGRITPKLSEAEAAPIAVQCNIHPWMKGWILIRDDPYAAVSDAHGKLTIRNVPAGKWTFRLWHERAGNVKRIVRGGKAEDLGRRGLVTLTIRAGENDLGNVKVPPDVFK